MSSKSYSSPPTDEFAVRVLLVELIIICEGYSGIRIRTDDRYIRNVASGGALYIVWLYAALEL